MNRIFSILLSIIDELIPYFRVSNRNGFISVILILFANSIPAIGVIFLRWDPYLILIIYWMESLIIGVFNLLKMFISGTIQNRKFSPSGFAEAIGFGLFFTFHYGMFMFVHGAFLIVFMMLSLSMHGTGSTGFEDPFSALSFLFPGNLSLIDMIESWYSAIAALFISHLISFYIYFLKSGEYNYTTAENYMLRPYKRILIMHMTIILGAFALFITGFKSAVFVIVWIGLKTLFDLKMHVREIKSSQAQKVEAAGQSSVSEI